MIRLFIALELSMTQRKEVGEFQEKVKRHLSNVRWVKRENIHLTLKFLGETEDARVEQVKAAVNAACSDVEPFLIRYGESGVFPTVKKARIFWVGVKEGQDSLGNFVEIIEEEMAGLGYRKEKRPFHPHLTIGRARNAPPENSINKYLTEGISFESSSMTINKVVLFESRLNRSGAIYRPLYEKELL